MIRLDVSRTGKNPNPKDLWCRFDDYVKYFDTLSEAKAYLKKEYFYCKKRVPCYQEVSGKDVQTGWIYCYKEKDYDQRNGEPYTYYHRDWCTLAVENRQPIDVRKK